MTSGLLLLASLLPAQTSAQLPNLDFSSGKVEHWEGQGFIPGPASGSGPSLNFAVSSSDRGPRGLAALLHRTFTIPPGTAWLRFRAAAIRPRGVAEGPPLDVILEASGREVIPKQVLAADGPRTTPSILPPLGKRLRDYVWDVSGFGGRRVRIALIDSDSRPGCYLACGGFSFVSADIINSKLFTNQMDQITKANKLRPAKRYDSRHFVALSNADAGFTEYRLGNCETIHALFFDHFRRRGFTVKAPVEKMMVAIFDGQNGFEAYMGQAMSTAVTGVYHRGTNRLVVYDYSKNRSFLASKEMNKEVVRKAGSDLERERLLVDVARHERTRRDDVNISTVMHEVAHQLSFNCGLLARNGDVPAWLAEGLAVYCESTVDTAWQGIGEPNPQRAQALAEPARRKGGFLPLRALVENDDWLRKAERVDQVLLGYAQSWALFSYLMTEKPKQLQRYLATLRARRTPDHRLTDFAESFGEMEVVEKRYFAYLREVVRQQAPEGRR